jgi:hypothetical protein
MKILRKISVPTILATVFILHGCGENPPEENSGTKNPVALGEPKTPETPKLKDPESPKLPEEPTINVHVKQEIDSNDSKNELEKEKYDKLNAAKYTLRVAVRKHLSNKILDLSNKGLTDFPSIEEVDCDKITKIDLSYNPNLSHENLEEFISNFKNLSSLNLSNSFEDKEEDLLKEVLKVCKKDSLKTLFLINTFESDDIEDNILGPLSNNNNLTFKIQTVALFDIHPNLEIIEYKDHFTVKKINN